MRTRLVCLIFVALWGAPAAADRFTDEEVLGPPAPTMRVDSVRLRFTHFEQDGHGYQSQATSTPGAPGSQWMQVEQPQVEVTATQGRFTHRLWIPVDVVTAASPDAVDAISTASRTNEAVSIDLASTYHGDRGLDVAVRGAFHAEENFRSWLLGAGFAKSLADGNAVVSGSLNQVFDWFDRYSHVGGHQGRNYRSTTNVNLAIVQLLSPTTIAALAYGGTVQLGQLGNTWNAVPLVSGGYGDENMPRFRQRHALSARIAQGLPWRAALKAQYRLYIDDWGILAHTLEAQYSQHLGPFLRVRFSYRLHHQSAASFFTTSTDTDTMMAPGAPPVTADSDLAEFWAHDLGALLVLEWQPRRWFRDVHIDAGYERYWRTNDLHVDLITCATGFRF